MSKNEQKRIQKKMNRKLAQGLAVRFKKNLLWFLIKTSDYLKLIFKGYNFTEGLLTPF